MIDFHLLLALHNYDKLIKMHSINEIAEIIGADISNIPPDGAKKYIVENFQEELKQAVKHMEITYE